MCGSCESGTHSTTVIKEVLNVVLEVARVHDMCIVYLPGCWFAKAIKVWQNGNLADTEATIETEQRTKIHRFALTTRHRGYNWIRRDESLEWLLW